MRPKISATTISVPTLPEVEWVCRWMPGTTSVATHRAAALTTSLIRSFMTPSCQPKVTYRAFVRVTEIQSKIARSSPGARPQGSSRWPARWAYLPGNWRGRRLDSPICRWQHRRGETWGYLLTGHGGVGHRGDS